MPVTSLGSKKVVSASIDGESVVRIFVDGDRVFGEPPVRPTTFYWFDDMSQWETAHGGQNNSRVLTGSNSYYSGNNNTGLQAETTPFPEGVQLQRFEYSYQETGSSTGHGVRLVNSNGNYEGGTATDNPEFDVDFANSSGQENGGGSYGEWVTVCWNFDWSENIVTVRRDGSSAHTNTYNLKQGLDISTIELWNYNGGNWGDNDLDSWWDGIQLYTDTSIVETFENGTFGPAWNVDNFHIESQGQTGQYAAGSRSDGEIDAVWNPFEQPQQIPYFEYSWWETSNQTGHVVILEDENGNEVMESGNENPQWYLNTGSGGRTQIYGGDGYQRWTTFKFKFNWDSGTYDYILKDTSTTTIKSGTQELDTTNPVDRIRFTGSGYGSADDVVFDNLVLVTPDKFNLY